MSGAILIVGATSGAGKSTVTAALCRILARRGGPTSETVAPFKAQNMSNHAAVTADGGEIGRAQATQASACGIDFDRRMNPVLLKPTSNHRSHMVVMGDEIALADAHSYGPTSDDLKPVVLDALQSLRQEFDWVVAEGAGGAAEINLLDRDLVNLPLARAAGMKSLLVVDIDRGGAFAAAYGTIELVPPKLRATIGGVLFNRFRGDKSMLDSGIVDFERRTGVPVLGVLPALEPGPMLGVEDSLDIAIGPVAAPPNPADRPPSEKPVRVAVIRLPHLANPSDFDPLLIEPDVSLRWATRAEDLIDADLVIVPGSRATVRDLTWLRQTGLAEALTSGRDDQTIIGICGGYQMCGRTIDDELESGEGMVGGLGLLDLTTSFAEPKIVRRSTGRLPDGPSVEGYQIRWGRPVGAADPWLMVDGEPEGATAMAGSRRIHGTSLHGVFDHDPFRHQVLAEIAARTGRKFRPGELTLSSALDRQHDLLAHWLERHSEVDRVVGLARSAAQPSEWPGKYGI